MDRLVAWLTLMSIVVCVVLSSSAAFCASDEALGASPSEIRVEGTFPFSGAGSALSAAGKGLIAYVDFLNDKGGIKVRKVNLIALDDAYSPPKAVEQTPRMVESDEVAFIFGQQGTPTNSATVKYLNSRKVPGLFIITGGSKFTDSKLFPYTTTGITNYESGRTHLRQVRCTEYIRRQDPCFT